VDAVSNVSDITEEEIFSCRGFTFTEEDKRISKYLIHIA